MSKISHKLEITINWATSEQLGETLDFNDINKSSEHIDQLNEYAQHEIFQQLQSDLYTYGGELEHHYSEELVTSLGRWELIRK